MKSWKILAVDDEPDILVGLEMRLKAAGYTVCTAADGLEATRTAIREQPDLILLDIGIPGGSGHMVVDRLRNIEETSGIPIIFLTASTGGEDIRRALAGGVQRYITKPFDSGQLLTTIEDTLDRFCPQP